MPTLNLLLTLRADVIQTAEASSLGVHHSLEYIRGSTLLGAAAAKCYKSLENHAYTAFHSGKVRFLDAVLLDQHGLPSAPAPLGWLHPKERKPTSSGWLDPAKIFTVNNLQPGEAAERSLRQMRAGFFTAAGQWLEAHRHYRLKTAIDRTSRGRPDEGNLFGYESLPAGSRWLARVELDEDVDESIQDALASVFDDRLIWLGRSRAAEYGRVHVRLVGPRPGGAAESVGGSAERLAICLESDTALLDPHTQEPTLTACPEHFGLPSAWRLVASGSAVATRRFSPFNGKRHRRDLERLVLGRGSVLTFEGRPAVDLEDIRTCVQQGVGCWRQEGLGQVRVAPWYLESLHPEFNERQAQSEAKAELTPVQEPPGPLARWILQRATDRQQADLAFRQAQQAAEGLTEILHRMGRQGTVEVPTRSQWNRLAGIVRRHLDQPSLDQPSARIAKLETALALELFKTASDRRGLGANLWQAEYQNKPFSHWTLEKGLRQQGSLEDWPATTRLWCFHHTALLMVRHLSKNRHLSKDRVSKEGAS